MTVRRTPQSKRKATDKRAPNSHIGFAGTPVREQSETVRRVPLGFSPTQTTNQVQIAR